MRLAPPRLLRPGAMPQSHQPLRECRSQTASARKPRASSVRLFPQTKRAAIGSKARREAEQCQQPDYTFCPSDSLSELEGEGLRVEQLPVDGARVRQNLVHERVGAARENLDPAHAVLLGQIRLLGE